MKRIKIAIQIDTDRCIRCGKCARVCPANVLLQEQAKAPITVRKAENCIVCAHCVDVCPQEAIQHSEFPTEKIHPIDYSQMPTSDQLMWLLKARRSNRTLTSKPIPSEWLDQIIEAGYYAPTATNSQLLSFTLVTQPEKLKEVADFTISVFDSIAKKLLNPIIKCILKPFMKDLYAYVPAFKKMKRDHEEGKDPILRKATALLFIHTPTSYRFGAQDANLAYQNASLMAQSLGVSQIYMGFVLTATKQDKKRRLEKMLGIDGTIHAVMALGIPAFSYPNYADRKPLSIKRIEQRREI